MRFSLYILFKNCSNLSLNSSGAYLYSSELMLSCPGVLPFFVNFNTFSNSSKVIKSCEWSAKLYSNGNSFMFVVFHNYAEDNIPFATVDLNYRTAYLKRREVNCKEFPVHARKTNREVELELHSFLTSALDACVWSASREVQFIPRRKSPLSPLNRRRGWLQSRYVGFGKEENLWPYWTSNHNSSSVHPVP